MDYIGKFNELREQIAVCNFKVDLGKLDQQHREMKNELFLKRKQVIQLKSELDSTNLKIFETNRIMEINKAALKETEFNLEIAVRKSNTVDEKIKELDEARMKMHMKEEIRVAETQILNQNVQELVRDKHRLMRQVDDLKDQLIYHLGFQKELESRQNEIKIVIKKINAESIKLENQTQEVIEFGNKMNCVEEFSKKNEFLGSENQKLKEENVKLENTVIELSAKNKILEELLKKRKYTDPNENNIISNFQCLQYKALYKNIKQQLDAQDKVIGDLTTALNKAITANSQLVLRIEEYASVHEHNKNNISIIKLENV